MATSETRGVMGYVDEQADLHIHYPVTEGSLVTFDGAASGLSSDNVGDALNELAAAKGAKGLAFSLSLPVSGWSNSAQTVSDARLVAAGYVYVILGAAAGYQDYSECQVRAGDVTTDGQVTFTASTTPTADITVNVVRIEVET